MDLFAGDPERQSRWKVLVRGILILPNSLVLAVLQLVVAVVVVLMWFAALITGRVPKGLWEFVAGTLRWSARTSAYGLLLTDRYPPFTLEDRPYPVAISLRGPPERFNRASVLFRVVLALPASVVGAAFNLGLSLVFVASWFCTLILGRSPRPLHWALAAGLRYQLRFSAYVSLLTTVYPWGLLGDGPLPRGSASPPGNVHLVGSARGFAVTALVLGVLYVGVVVLATVLAATVVTNTQEALNAMTQRVETATARYLETVDTCNSVRCNQRAAPMLHAIALTEIATYRSLTYPTRRAASDATKIINLLERQDSVLSAMEAATSEAAYLDGARELEALTVRIAPLALDLHVRVFHSLPLQTT